MDKTILKKWLKAGYMERQNLYPTEEGTPQGGIISPVLANLTLDRLEQRLEDMYRSTTCKGKKAKVHMIRYADDFIISGSSKELLEQEVKPLVETFMKERGLTLSPEKTVITHINEGFNFLGQNARKYDGTLLIKPSSKNVKTFLEKIRKIVKENKQAAVGNLIWQLNPVIRGWAMYHRHQASKETFTKVDHAIFQLLWLWAKRRHPNKRKQWIKEKYFRTVGTRRWAFTGEIEDKKGETQEIQLYRATMVHIQRHKLIKGEANPYDPRWEEYFDQRLGDKWIQGTNRKKLSALWRHQDGKCPVCDQKITKETGWNIHHITYRVYGGTDKLTNLSLLHPNCHRQLHSQDLKETEPGIEKCLEEA